MRTGFPGSGTRKAAIIPPACLIAFALLSAGPGQRAEGQPPVAGTAGSPEAAPPTSLVLTVGKSVLIDSPLRIERVSVGFGDIAEATATSPSELLLNGKTPGVTSMVVWREGGARQVFDITVTASHFLAEGRVEAIKRQIEQELPGQTVNLSLENETVFLRGTVRDMTSADRAVTIASTLAKTVNLLYVDVPPPGAQILLKVKFASVDRSVSTQLGLNIVSTGAGNNIGTIGTQQFSPLGFSSVPPASPLAATLSDALNVFLFRSDLNLGATIQALEVKGFLQVLAEPNILAENGKPASFLAGGEFPFPSVSAASGGTPIVSIQFREYGIRLNFIPTITPRGTIYLQVAPEVSALDFTNGLSISGFNVPALDTRKLNTQVELSDGQSFAIGGLLDNRATDTFEKIPFIGDIPILGKLFQSKSVSRTNTELIVIVTPELVRPIATGQPVPALKFPQPFLAPNTGTYPRTPGMDVTGPVPLEGPNEAIPVEELIQSLRPLPAQLQQFPSGSPAPAAPAIPPPQ